jgi:hypothetical protein
MWDALRKIAAAGALLISVAGTAYAQDDDSSIEAKTTLDDAPLTAPRTAAMGGASSTLADDIDASWANPAGIGGYGWGDKKIPTMRKFYFPFVGIAANENAREFQEDFSSEGGAGNADVGSTLLEANAGKRQYVRSTAALGAVAGRLLILPFYDLQIAAVGRGGGTDLVAMKYRSMSGVGFGGSIPAAENSVHLGWYSTWNSITQIEGTFLHQDIARKDRRSEVLKEATRKYSGMAHNVGISWAMGKVASPRLAIVARNLQGASFAPSNAEDEPLKMREDLAMGFSVSPKVGNYGTMNWTLDVTRLSDRDVTLRKKIRSGIEYEFGPHRGSYSLFALRAGVNHAGASFGASANLGLICIETASHAEDIGAGNNRVIEQRNTGVIYVNVAEF